MKAVPGKPLLTGPIGSASFQNLLVDMVDWYKRRVLGDPRRALPAPIPTDVIKVKNGSGADQNAGKVLEPGRMESTTKRIPPLRPSTILGASLCKSRWTRTSTAKSRIP